VPDNARPMLDTAKPMRLNTLIPLWHAFQQVVGTGQYRSVDGNGKSRFTGIEWVSHP
jgi:hypothetical protein